MGIGEACLWAFAAMGWTVLIATYVYCARHANDGRRL